MRFCCAKLSLFSLFFSFSLSARAYQRDNDRWLGCAHCTFSRRLRKSGEIEAFASLIDLCISDAWKLIAHHRGGGSVRHRHFCENGKVMSRARTHITFRSNAMCAHWSANSKSNLCDKSPFMQIFVSFSILALSTTMVAVAAEAFQYYRNEKRDNYPQLKSVQQTERDRERLVRGGGGEEKSVDGFHSFTCAQCTALTLVYSPHLHGARAEAN